MLCQIYWYLINIPICLLFLLILLLVYVCIYVFLASLARGLRRSDASLRRAQMMWRGRASQLWNENDPEQLLFPHLFSFQHLPQYREGEFNDNVDQLYEGESARVSAAQILEFTTELLALANNQIEGNVNQNLLREAQYQYIREFDSFLDFFNNVNNIIPAPVIEAQVDSRIIYPDRVGTFFANNSTITNIFAHLKTDPEFHSNSNQNYTPVTFLNSLGEPLGGPASVALERLRNRATLIPNANQCVPLTALVPYLNALYYRRVPETIPFIFLTGAAGSGKTFVFSCAEELVIACHKEMSITAMTGAACTAIRTENGARTTQSYFHLGWTSMAYKRPLSEQKLLAMREKLQNVAIIIIDEISFMAGGHLLAISNRLKQIKENHLNFGGLAVILSGDFCQLPVVKNIPIYRLVLDLLENKNFDWNTGGARLFILFRRYVLRINHRSANDAILTQFCSNFRQGITTGLVEYLQEHILTSEDAQEFVNAPIISPGNLERHHSNFVLLRNFARRNNTRVISWVVPCTFPGLTGSVVDHISNMSNRETADRIFQLNPQLRQHFVVGAPIYNKYNTNALRGLANGTKAFQYALEWRTPEIRRQALQYLETNAVNDVVLPYGLEPFQILERPVLNNELTNSWPDNCTLIPGDIIIPIEKVRKTISITAGSRNIDVSIKRFDFEFGFIKTVHIMQGQSEPIMIISLLDRPGLPTRADWTSIYTALTRLILGNNLRIIGRMNDLEFITSLRPPPDLVHFNNSYDDNGNWIWNAVLRRHDILRAANTTSNRGRGRGGEFSNRGSGRGIGSRAAAAAAAAARERGVVGTDVQGAAANTTSGGERSYRGRGRAAWGRSGQESANSASAAADNSSAAAAASDSHHAVCSSRDSGQQDATNISAEQRLANVTTFSDFYCPILRDVFFGDSITRDAFRVQLQILEYYWNPVAQISLRDSIHIVRNAYQMTGFFDRIGLLIQNQTHIDAQIQENLFLYFRTAPLNPLIPLMVELRNYRIENLYSEDIVIINEFIYQIDFAIARFQNDYNTQGTRVFNRDAQGIADSVGDQPTACVSRGSRAAAAAAAARERGLVDTDVQGAAASSVDDRASDHAAQQGGRLDTRAGGYVARDGQGVDTRARARERRGRESASSASAFN